MTAVRAERPFAGSAVAAYRRGMADGARGRTATVVDAEPAEPAAQVLEECALAYGRDLLAYLLGAGTDAPLANWRLNGHTADVSGDRLRVAYHVLQAFKEPRRAKAWMRQASSQLGGRSHAWAIRSGEPDLLALVEREADRAA
jgi:hypothetical protein